jgi:serine/threonine protein kinase
MALIGDRYRLERAIASGGSATIWEAKHLALHRSVALKFIAIAGTPSKVRERFLREARAAAAVRHRNVVDILDFGTAEDGRPFMAMELLVGETLATRMERSPPNPAEAVRIVAQILSGLAAVHDAGLVHRDLKPENVFLAEDADGVIPKLLDFGVSRAMDPRGVLKSVLPTVENLIVGTPHYMAPEQARALSTIDHRADIWSVGVIAFELFTGVLPFDADAIGDVIIQVATKTPPDLALLRPDLAGPLTDVVKKAMTRDPELRWQSARQMRSALLSAAGQTARIGDVSVLLENGGEPGDSGLIRVGAPRGEIGEASTLEAGAESTAEPESGTRRAEAPSDETPAMGVDAVSSEEAEQTLPSSTASWSGERAVHTPSLELAPHERPASIAPRAGWMAHALRAWGLFGLAGVAALGAVIALGALVFAEPSPSRAAPARRAAGPSVAQSGASIAARAERPPIAQAPLPAVAAEPAEREPELEAVEEPARPRGRAARPTAAPSRPAREPDPLSRSAEGLLRDPGF